MILIITAEDVTLQRVGVASTDDGANYLRLKDKPYFTIWLPNHDSLEPENIFKLNKKRKQFSMGSAPSNDLVLADPQIAPQQASVKMGM